MTPEEFDNLDDNLKRSLRAGLSPLGKAACDYAEMGWSVLPLRPRSKVPAIEGGFKNACDDWENACWWWLEHPDCNIGIATGSASNGLVVIDVDQNEYKGKYGEESLLEWEKANGKLPDTVCATTGSGGTHYYYRTPTCVKSSVNRTLCIDRRGDGGYVVAPPSVHPDGTMYDWDLNPYDYDVAFADNRVLEFFAYCDGGDSSQSPSDGTNGDGKYVFPEVVHDGEGREQHLVTLAFSLRAQGYDYNQIYTTLMEVNEVKVIPPKPTKDIKRIAKSACRKPAGLSPEYAAAKERSETRRAREAELAAQEYEERQRKAELANIVDEEELEPINPEDFVLGKSGLNHALVGEDVIKRFHFCFVDGSPAIWTGDRYETGWAILKKTLSQYKRTIKETERKEVCYWLEINAPNKKPAPWNYIAFNNGILDVSSMELLPRSSRYIVQNIIPHNWNPAARSDLLDETLEGIACGEAGTLANMYEMIGMSLCRGAHIAKAFFIINNNGANGKSTFLRLLEAILGDNNVSHVDPQIMGERFQSTPMMGKLANLSDDIPPDIARSSSLSILKKVVTGDSVPYEIKGGISSSFKPYCTCIFTMNKMPPLGDGSGGMIRRIHPVSFHANFNEDSPTTDIYRREKLASEECCEAAIVKGVHALVAMVERGNVTKTDFSRRESADISIENNQVKAFLLEQDVDTDSIHLQSTSILYDEYALWADQSGIRNTFSSVRFRREVKDLLGIKVEKTKRGDGVQRYKYICD